MSSDLKFNKYIFKFNLLLSSKFRSKFYNKKGKFFIINLFCYFTFIRSVKRITIKIKYFNEIEHISSLYAWK